MRRYAFIGLLVLVLAATSCVMLRTCWARLSPAIASTGGKDLHIRLPDDGKTHLQKDKRWAADQLGTSTGTLGSHGCLVSSVAMACSDLGVKLTPKELNERLQQADGFQPWERCLPRGQMLPPRRHPARVRHRRQGRLGIPRPRSAAG